MSVKILRKRVAVHARGLAELRMRLRTSGVDWTPQEVAQIIEALDYADAALRGVQRTLRSAGARQRMAGHHHNAA